MASTSGSHTYLAATPAVSAGQAGRVDDMVVGEKVEDKDKDEKGETAEEEKEEENVKEDQAKETYEEDKDDKENEGTEDTAGEAELELSRWENFQKSSACDFTRNGRSSGAVFTVNKHW